MRVQWDEIEQTALIQKSAELMRSSPGLGHLDALRSSQQELFSTDRQRKILTLTAVPWFRKEVDKLLKEQPTVIDQQVVEEVIIQPMTLSDVSTDDLINEFLRRIGASGIMNQIANAAVSALRAEMPQVVNKIRESTASVTPRPKKVLIVGLQNEQQNEISKKFSTIFDLSFWTDGNTDSLKAKAKHSDKICLMKKFIAHSHQATLRSVGVHYSIVPGCLTELSSVLEKYFYQGG